MPYYRITVTDIYGKVSQGVKEDHLTDIDAYYQKAYRKAYTTMKGLLKSIDVVMLPTQSPDVLKHLAKKRNGAI